MKVRIKSFNGELYEHLTDGKEYEIEEYDGDSAWLNIDDDSCIFILINGCRYLNGGSWEIVND